MRRRAGARPQRLPRSRLAAFDGCVKAGYSVRHAARCVWVVLRHKEGLEWVISVASAMTVVTGAFGGVRSPREPTELAVS